jgi:predicted deacylase
MTEAVLPGRAPGGAPPNAAGAPSALPRFDVLVEAPDITPWLAGNTGIEGFTSVLGARPGPHVVLLALTHGNEICGAVALDRLLRAGLRPACGRLTFGFANLAAFARFDPAHPTASRFLDEDMNRLWDEPILDGARHSSELDRARQMRPLLDSADLVLDLHSMLWPSEPLLLSGPTAKGRQLACSIGRPALVVADGGHVSGKRLIDYGRFADPTDPAAAVLVEAGQHWQPDAVDMTMAAIAGLLHHAGLTEDTPPPAAAPSRVAEVTTVVTAATAGFAFVQPYRGGDVVTRRNTLIALDGPTEIRTPHDDCLLVMPSLRPSRGHTAVRLARFVQD